MTCTYHHDKRCSYLIRQIREWVINYYWFMFVFLRLNILIIYKSRPIFIRVKFENNSKYFIKKKKKNVLVNVYKCKIYILLFTFFSRQ